MRFTSNNSSVVRDSVEYVTPAATIPRDSSSTSSSSTDSSSSTSHPPHLLNSQHSSLPRLSSPVIANNFSLCPPSSSSLCRASFVGDTGKFHLVHSVFKLGPTVFSGPSRARSTSIPKTNNCPNSEVSLRLAKENGAVADNISYNNKRTTTGDSGGDERQDISRCSNSFSTSAAINGKCNGSDVDTPASVETVRNCWGNSVSSDENATEDISPTNFKESFSALSLVSEHASPSLSSPLGFESRPVTPDSPTTNSSDSNRAVSSDCVSNCTESAVSSYSESDSPCLLEAESLPQPVVLNNTTESCSVPESCAQYKIADSTECETALFDKHETGCQWSADDKPELRNEVPDSTSDLVPVEKFVQEEVTSLGSLEPSASESEIVVRTEKDPEVKPDSCHVAENLHHVSSEIKQEPHDEDIGQVTSDTRSVEHCCIEENLKESKQLQCDAEHPVCDADCDKEESGEAPKVDSSSDDNIVDLSKNRSKLIVTETCEVNNPTGRRLSNCSKSKECVVSVVTDEEHSIQCCSKSSFGSKSSHRKKDIFKQVVAKIGECSRRSKRLSSESSKCSVPSAESDDAVKKECVEREVKKEACDTEDTDQTLYDANVSENTKTITNLNGENNCVSPNNSIEQFSATEDVVSSGIGSTLACIDNTEPEETNTSITSTSNKKTHIIESQGRVLRSKTAARVVARIANKTSSSISSNKQVKNNAINSITDLENSVGNTVVSETTSVEKSNEKDIAVKTIPEDNITALDVRNKVISCPVNPKAKKRRSSYCASQSAVCHSLFDESVISDKVVSASKSCGKKTQSKGYTLDINNFRRTTRSLSVDAVPSDRALEITSSTSIPTIEEKKVEFTNSTICQEVTSTTTSVVTSASCSVTSTEVTTVHNGTVTRLRSSASSSCSKELECNEETASCKKTNGQTSSKAQDMVRFVQEFTSPLHSYCRRKGNRTSRRLVSADAVTNIERRGRLTGVTRRCLNNSGCRSDYYSESEESSLDDENSRSELRNGRSCSRNNGLVNFSTSLCSHGVSNQVGDKTGTRSNAKRDEVFHKCHHDSAIASDAKEFNSDLDSNSQFEGTNGKILNRKHGIHRLSYDDSDSNCGNNCLDNDRVDINLLLEISVADRNKFEKKKSQISRMTADWMLISETEKLYNERQEITKRKNKGDSSSDEDGSESDYSANYTISNTRLRTRNRVKLEEHSSEDSDSNLSLAIKRKTKSSRLKYSAKSNGHVDNSKNKNKCSVDSKGSNRCDSVNLEAKCKNESKPLEQKSQESNSTGLRPRGRPRGSRNRRTIYDLTKLHEDTDDDNFFSFPVNSGLGNSPVLILSQQAGRMSRSRTILEKNTTASTRANGNYLASNSNLNKKRLSDAERFLRDNKEYYQFPETRDRLRNSHERVLEEKDKTTDSVKRDKKHLPDSEDDCEKEPEKKKPCVSGRILRPSKKVTKLEDCSNEEKSPCIVEAETNSDVFSESFKNNKTKREKLAVRCSKRHTSSNNTIEIDKVNEEKEPLEKQNLPIKESIVIDPGFVTDVIKASAGLVDKLSYSFEHVPVAEPWYQTYRRQIQGCRSHEIQFTEEILRFVLPYEMPKEYYRDHSSRRNVALKKRDLAELVRKSPRCHASTLALFSDILPGQRKKQRRLKTTRDDSQQGASKDNGTVSNIPSSNRIGCHIETLDDYIAIEHCMNMIFQAAAENREISIDDLTDAAELDKDEESKHSTNPCGKDKESAAKKSKKVKEETSDHSDLEPKKEIVSGKRKRIRKKSTCIANDLKFKHHKHERSESKEVAVSETVTPGEFLKSLNLDNDILAIEVDPNWLIEVNSLRCNETVIKTESNIDDSFENACNNCVCTLEQSTAALLRGIGSCHCLEQCTANSYCDDLSSFDDNATEVSSECMSLADCEPGVDTPGSGAFFRSLGFKKRRKNLTGWPKLKRKRTLLTGALSGNTSVAASDDNDSALGAEDRSRESCGVERRSRTSLRLSENLRQTSEIEENDRRASPRKRAGAGYIETLPMRFRSQKY